MYALVVYEGAPPEEGEEAHQQAIFVSSFVALSLA